MTRSCLVKINVTYIERSQSERRLLSGRGNLLQQIGVRHGVLDITREVLHCLGLTGARQVIVHPAQQQLFFGELEQVFAALAVVEQEHQAWMMRQVDLGE